MPPSTALASIAIRLVVERNNHQPIPSNKFPKQKHGLDGGGALFPSPARGIFSEIHVSAPKQARSRKVQRDRCKPCRSWPDRGRRRGGRHSAPLQHVLVGRFGTRRGSWRPFCISNVVCSSRLQHVVVVISCLPRERNRDGHLGKAGRFILSGQRCGEE